MKLIWNKALMLLIILTLALSTLAACSSGGNNAAEGDPEPSSETESGNNSTDSNQSGGEKPATSDGKFNVTISTAMSVNDDTKFKKGETTENNVHTRWAKEKLGITFEFDFITAQNDDYETKLRLALAGGQGLPDAFHLYNEQLIDEMIESGQLRSIDEAIEKYARPELKEIYKEHSQAFTALKRDGKTYGLPMYPSMSGGTVLWIRTDWLKNVGLEMPKTMDDMEKVLEAFTNGDPDGNGQKDTFGLTLGLREGINEYMSTADWVVGAYGDYMPGHWGMKDGKLVYGGIQDNVKQALGTLREWFDKGYIDPEAGIKHTDKAAQPFIQGKAGITSGPYWMVGWPLRDLTKNFPEAEFAPLALPTGPDGNFGRNATNMFEGAILFSKDFEHMDAFFAYLNEVYSFKLGDKDSEFYNGFHEGYDYVEYNGKIYRGNLEETDVPKSEWPLPDGEMINVQKFFPPLNGVDPDIPYIFDEPLLKFAANPDAPAETVVEEKVKGWNPLQVQAGAIRIGQNDHGVINYFTGAPTKTMQSKQELLDKLEAEAYTKIIYGEQSLDSFEDFVKNWKASGGDQITQEVNEWYQATQ